MSTEASDIVSSLTTALRQHLIELHNQNINDIQAIVARLEVRMVEELIGIKDRLAQVEARLPWEDQTE